ncbi:hypothetical protein C7999DRAFT_44404 [Corynascus novoguineensis]|uniref:Uncharacterized protein n=1 Tax=Corynascus novoguineensis TaxID=1126955 RepID=A0AAN7CKN0_9PEZI|nr:hypothetical protein C7999DRAFT_44404 [Corynascus novoguineensis]
MDDDALQAFYDSASDKAKDWLANALYYRELETIRRDKPLLDPQKYAERKIDLYCSDGPPLIPGVMATRAVASPDFNLRDGAASNRLAPVHPKRKRSLNNHFPWFLARVLAKVTSVYILDDNDGGDNTEQTPPVSGPLSGMQIDIPEIRKSIGYTKAFEKQFPNEIQVAKEGFLTTGYEHMDQESMFKAPDWLGNLRRFEGRTALFKGFPMVEDVVFIKHPNYWQELESHGKLIESGQCYWLAVALLMYGNAYSWLRVKAEHLSFLERVLTNPDHPRHAFYTRENQNIGATRATGPSGASSQWSGKANLWERLQIPGCWVNEDICQLTADLYGVFLVLYKYDSEGTNPQWKGKVYDMKTYGAYNNRHIFLCYYNENHFQPMIPNEYYASEFKLPRLTLANTEKYGLVTRKRARRARDGPGHHWRAQPQLVPALVRPSFESEHLARAVGYGQNVNNLLPRPGRSSGPLTQPSKLGKKDTHLLANSNALKSAKVAGEVVSLLREETSAAGTGSGLTQADTLGARNAIRVLQRYIDKVTGTELTESGCHSLPAARRQSAGILAFPDPRGKGKRPAVDDPGPSKSSPKRLRTPVTLHIGQSIVPGSNQSTPIPHPTSASQGSHAANNDGQGFQQLSAMANLGRTFFRAASKTMLTKQRVARLRRWCLDLELAPGDEIANEWKKERCVHELIGAKAEVRMKRIGTGGGSAVLGEGVENRGVEVVRLPIDLNRVRVGGDGDRSVGDGHEDDRLYEEADDDDVEREADAEYLEEEEDEEDAGGEEDNGQ